MGAGWRSCGEGRSTLDLAPRGTYNGLVTESVLVVEDEKEIRELLRRYLERAGYAVTTSGSGAEAIRLLSEGSGEQIRLVVLDLGLPDVDGTEVLRAAREHDGRVPVVVLTARSAVEDRIRGLELGADDYVTKPFSPKELLARARALLRRKSPEHAQELMSAGAVTLDPGSFTVEIDKQKIDIGHAEFKLLKFLMAHRERVFSRSQLLDKVWGDHVSIEERTVDVHVLRLRKALKESEHLIKTVRSVGYMLSEK